MSNIKKNYFNPGANRTSGTIKLPSSKVNSTFNPTYSKKLPKRLINTMNTDTKITTKSNIYLKRGKPGKPDTGSMDRILRLKAQAMSK